MSREGHSLLSRQIKRRLTQIERDLSHVTEATCTAGQWMNGKLFDLHVKTQLAPTLQSGDVIILNNLSPHKSPTATAALKAVGAGFRFRAKPSTGCLCCPSNLPPYSPDLNPIEMAFAKLKALIQRAAARTYDELWQAVCHVCDIFTEEECYNFFKAAGSETDRTQHALGRKGCDVMRRVTGAGSGLSQKDRFGGGDIALACQQDNRNIARCGGNGGQQAHPFQIGHAQIGQDGMWRGKVCRLRRCAGV